MSGSRSEERTRRNDRVQARTATGEGPDRAVHWPVATGLAAAPYVEYPYPVNQRARKARSADGGEIATGASLGLLAAALFGASAPLSKLLLPGTGPLALAALLYLGASIALCLASLGRRLSDGSREAPLRNEDLPALIGIAAMGGVAGPVLMLVGLERLPALTSALLLNLEAPLTMLLAVVLFREHLDRRERRGALLILAGAAVLSYRPGELGGDWIGVLAIAGACLCWAVDNNLTQRLSIRDPITVVQFKTLVAGSFSLVLALVLHQPFAGAAGVGAALVLGSLSYGLSVVLDMHALRRLGAAREAAIFATAPFVGAVLAISILGERPAWTDAVGSLAMILGVASLLRARHRHRHTHDPLEHDHLHSHDEHHQHVHEGAVSEPHAHSHIHDPLTHEHDHVSDVHHRHEHL